MACRAIDRARLFEEATQARKFVEAVIDSLATGREVTSSPFRDCVKTMDVAERILAVAALADE